MGKKILHVFRKYFVTGMVVIVPVWVTVLIIKAVVNFIDNSFALLPSQLHPRTYIPFFGVEIIIAIVLIFVIGILASNFFGKKIIGLGEIVVTRIPVIKTIYQAVKHLTTGIFSEKKIFSRVVLLEFPIKGLSFIGFVTGEGTSLLPNSGGKKMLKIFIPTTPNPTSGFFCMAEEDQVQELDMSVDEAFKVIISAGYGDAVNSS
ncbi:MAG: DUF502 domain-containing protein [Candidatus Aminicenantes bacterium]|nr:DUF502 domain-containing protein [Candidatus Aminicenantes bacterium]